MGAWRRRIGLLLLLGAAASALSQEEVGLCGTLLLTDSQASPFSGRTLAAPPALPGDRLEFFVHFPEDRIEAELLAQGRHGEVWSDVRLLDRVPADRVRQLLEEFDRTIYPQTRQWMGSEPLPGVDGLPRVLILLHDVEANGSAQGFGGYFADEDLIPSLPNSNAREMLYLDAFALSEYEPTRLYALLAHEFAHLISWYQRGGQFDERWLEEGRASFVEWALYGVIHAGFLRLYLNDPAQSLTTANTQGTWYGGGFLWALYLYEQFGGRPTVQAWARSRIRGLSAVAELLGRERTTEAVLSWALANAIQNPALHPRLGYRNVPERFRVPDSAIERLEGVPVERTWEMAEWGVRYARLITPEGGERTLWIEGERPEQLIAGVWRPRTGRIERLQTDAGRLFHRMTAPVPGDSALVVLISGLAQRVRLRIVPGLEGAGTTATLPLPTPVPRGEAVALSVPLDRPELVRLHPVHRWITAVETGRMAFAGDSLWTTAPGGLIQWEPDDPQGLSPKEWIALSFPPQDVDGDPRRLVVALGRGGIELRSADGRVVLSRYQPLGAVRRVRLWGDYLFALLAEGGLLVLRDEGGRLTLQQRVEAGIGLELAVGDRRLAVSDDRFGLRIFALDRLPALELIGVLARPLVGISVVGEWVWGGAGALWGVAPPAGEQVVPTVAPAVGTAWDGGQLLAVAEQEGGLRLMDLADPLRPQTIERFQTPGRPVAVLWREGRLFVLEREGALSLWTREGPNGPVEFRARRAFAFRPLRLLDERTAVGVGGLLLWEPSDNETPIQVPSLSVLGAGVWTGERLLLGGERGMERLFGGEVRPWEALEEPVRDVALSPDGRTVAVAAGDLYLYQIAGEELLRLVRLPVNDLPVRLLWVDETLFVATALGGVELFSLDNPAAPVRLGALPVHNVRAMAQENRRLWIASANEVALYDIADPRQPRELARRALGWELWALKPDGEGVLLAGSRRLERWRSELDLPIREEGVELPGEALDLAVGQRRVLVALRDGLLLFQRTGGGLFVRDPVVEEPPEEPSAGPPWVGRPYPNPFRERVLLPIRVGAPARARWEIYALDGRRIWEQEISILESQRYPLGALGLEWNGRNALGEPVARGVYLYRVLLSPSDKGAPLERFGRVLFLGPD